MEIDLVGMRRVLIEYVLFQNIILIDAVGLQASASEEVLYQLNPRGNNGRQLLTLCRLSLWKTVSGSR